MKSLTRGSLKLASMSLKANKGRSFLTMLGIILGVASVITVVSIGFGIKQQVTVQLNHLGRDLITVRAGNKPAPSLTSFGSLATPYSNTVLNGKDLQVVRSIKGVQAAVPMGIIAGEVKSDTGDYVDGPVIATAPDLLNLLNLKMAYGNFFSSDGDEAEADEAAILGAHAAQTMFRESVPLGRTFSFRGQEFMVRGILDEYHSPPLAPDINFNDAIFIPLATAGQLTHDNTTFYELLAKPTDARQTDSVAAAIRSSLLRMHGDSHDFSVIKASEAQAATNEIITLVTNLVAAVAAVSLLVGGIGIMNIMLVSVTERMHEVGIRKAVGATNRQILNEFMAEATVLSLVGGIIGVVIALLINGLLRLLTDFAPITPWQSVVVAVGVSMLIGIVFGSAPALNCSARCFCSNFKL